jgi:hypothetical protein
MEDEVIGESFFNFELITTSYELQAINYELSTMSFDPPNPPQAGGKMVRVIEGWKMRY